MEGDQKMSFKKFGIHYVALQCSDVNDRAWTRNKFREFKTWGIKHIKLISSPGGDGGWENKEMGCCERSLLIALEEGLRPTVRIFRGKGAKTYWDSDVATNLKRLTGICKPFNYVLPVEPGNEVDAEWGGQMNYADAVVVGGAIGEFAKRSFDMGGILPLFPSVGYGGPGINFFQAFYDSGNGHLLKNMGIAIHPYRGPYPLNWGTDYELKLMTREEYDSYHPWCWAKGAPDYVSFEMVNRARTVEIENRKKYMTLEQKMNQYNYGWFTIEWAAYMLEQFGISSIGKFHLTENGVEVGAKDKGVEVEPGVFFSLFPRVDPLHQAQMVLEETYAAEADPRIVSTAEWLPGNMKFSGNTPNWESQAWLSDWYDPRVVTLPWAEQIKTPGQLPIVDKLIELNKEQTPMSSKLFFHCQNPRDYTLSAIGATQPEYIKVMGNALNPDKIKLIRQYAPNAKLIGRYHLDNQPYDNPEVDAANLVSKIAETGCGPLIDIWESYNEVAVSTLNPQQVKNLDHFFATFHRLVQERFGVSYTIVVNSPTGNLGWPGEVSPADFAESLGLAGTIVSGHHYEYHQAPANDRTAFLFRWKKHVKQVLAKFPNKKFLLTEVGVTELALGLPHKDVGWNYNGAYSETEYMKVLYDLDVEMQQYPSVLGACVFQTGCNDDWLAAGFESSDQVKKHRMTFVPPVVVEPPVVYKEPIRVKRSSGEIQVMELEEYLRGVVIAEMYSTWPIEALKAQAVAARSYALWYMVYPAATNYDIGDSDRFQVYSDARNAKTDQAVKETAGIYLERDQDVLFAEYKARCGTSSCATCAGTSGTNGKEWPNQLCQYGARDMSLAGATYREILRFYYDDVTFSDEEESEEPVPVEDWVTEKDPRTDKYKYDPIAGKVVGCVYNVKSYVPRVGETYWKVRKIQFFDENEALGDHNCYLELEDENGNRIVGGQLKAAWPSTRLEGPYDEVITLTTEAGKAAEFIMAGGNFDPKTENEYGPYIFWATHGGFGSDVVYGGGLPGNRHVKAKIWFRKYTAKATEPPIPPVEVVVTLDDIRQAAWGKMKVPLNVSAAIQAFARKNLLGAPMSDEFDLGDYRIQCFVAGIAYVKIGDWQNIKYMAW